MVSKTKTITKRAKETLIFTSKQQQNIEVDGEKPSTHNHKLHTI